MRHGLHGMVVGLERLGYQVLAVAGRAHGQDLRRAALGCECVAHVLQRLARHIDGFALVRRVERVNQVLAFVDERELRGGGPGVDSQVAAHRGVRRDAAAVLVRQRMTALEPVPLLRAVEVVAAGAGGCGLLAAQRQQLVVGGGKVDGVGRVCEQLLQRQRGAQRHGRLGMLRHHDVCALQAQAFGEYVDQHGVERQRAALEDHRRRDVQALGQAADGLLRNGMERRARQVRFRNALVQQRLDVRFRIDAAAAGDVVHGRAACREVVEFRDGDVQQRRNLVDERARAAGAAAVHAHVRHVQLARLRVGGEERHLRVLAAQLDGRARLRVVRAHGDGVRHHFLHERHVQRLGHARATGAAEGGVDGGSGQMLVQVGQQRAGRASLAGMVPAVGGVEHVMRIRVDGHGLHRGRSHIDAHEDIRCGGAAGLRLAFRVQHVVRFLHRSKPPYPGRARAEKCIVPDIQHGVGIFQFTVLYSLEICMVVPVKGA